jgi:hypothetical protein
MFSEDVTEPGYLFNMRNKQKMNVVDVFPIQE